MKTDLSKQTVALLTDLEAESYPMLRPLIQTVLSCKAHTMRVIMTPDEASIRRIEKLRIALPVPTRPHLLLPKSMYRQILDPTLHSVFEAITDEYTYTRPYPGVNASGLLEDRALFRIQWYAAMRQLCVSSHHIVIRQEKTKGYFASAVGLLAQAYGFKMETIEARSILPVVQKDESLFVPICAIKAEKPFDESIVKCNKGKAVFRASNIRFVRST